MIGLCIIGCLICFMLFAIACELSEIKKELWKFKK